MSLEQHLSRRERQIMDVLHARRQATAAEVLTALPAPPSYSAVRALLRILEGKGHVKHRREGVRYVYFPRKSAETVRRSASKMMTLSFRIRN
jgi:BlaI family penicillinase repressor